MCIGLISCFLVSLFVFFFFFKQKTAYEMRISDWSSDVCSSDLPKGFFVPGNVVPVHHSDEILGGIPAECGFGEMRIGGKIAIRRSMQIGEIAAPTTRNDNLFPEIGRAHSELQSLMRISYAVFCLNKKIKSTTQTIT